MALAMMPDTGVSTPRRCAFLALTSVPRRGQGGDNVFSGIPNMAAWTQRPRRVVVSALFVCF